MKAISSRLISTLNRDFMKGIAISQHGGPNVLQLSDKIKIPNIKSPSESIIKVHVIGVNRSDYIQREGNGFNFKLREALL